MRNCLLGVRVTNTQRERLEKIGSDAGLTLSQVLRMLVENAELVSKPVVRTTIETNSHIELANAENTVA